MNDAATDHLMFYALGFTSEFTQAELRARTGCHPAEVGDWLRDQMLNGNLTRRRVDGVWRYSWRND